MVLTVISFAMVGCDFFDLALMANDELTQSQTGLGDTLVLPPGTINGWSGPLPTSAAVKAFDTEITSGSVRSIGGSPYFEGITIANSGSNPDLQNALLPLNLVFGDDLDVYGRFLIIAELHVQVGGDTNQITFSPPGESNTQLLTWWYVENSFSFTDIATITTENEKGEPLVQSFDLDLTLTEGWNMVLSNISSTRGDNPTFTSIDTLPNFSWNVLQDQKK